MGGVAGNEKGVVFVDDKDHQTIVIQTYVEKMKDLEEQDGLDRFSSDSLFDGSSNKHIPSIPL